MFNNIILVQVATAKGDYTLKQRRSPSCKFEFQYSILLGLQQAAITWVSSLVQQQHCECCQARSCDLLPTKHIAVQLFFVPTAMAMYACLVSHHLLDSSVFKVPQGSWTSPEGDVMFAALFTLAIWRSMYLSQMF